MVLDGPEEARCCCELGWPDAVEIAVVTCLLLLVGSGIVCIVWEETFGAAPRFLDLTGCCDLAGMAVFADSLIVDDLFAKGSVILFLAVVPCRVTGVVS